MNKHLVRLLAPVAIGAMSMNVALANDIPSEQKVLPSVPSDYEGDFIELEGEDVYCGMQVPPAGHPGKKYIIKGIINCAPGDLGAPGADDPTFFTDGIPSAAINILGNGLTVVIEDDVDCGGDVVNDGNFSGDFTYDINTIGVWVAGFGNKILGRADFDGKERGHINDCNVSMEVGYNGTTLQGPQVGLNLVEHFNFVDCNSGGRFLNSINRGHDLVASCGLLQLEDQTTAAPYPPVSSDGIVIGIDALNTTASCHFLPSVYFNTVSGSEFVGNNNGIVGGNQMRVIKPLDNFQVPTNFIVDNVIHDDGLAGIHGNLNAGILLAGTGFVVKNNDTYDNQLFGIDLSLHRPHCNPNYQTGFHMLTNLVTKNRAFENLGAGVAAEPSNGSPNAGTVFKRNHAYKNGRLDYFEGNRDCANGEIEWPILNQWTQNKGKFFNTPLPSRANVLCVLDQFKSNAG